MKGSTQKGEPFLLWNGVMWHVYICERRGLLYTGITTNLEHRIRQHGAQLLYAEAHQDKHAAAQREREIKGWRREKKLALVARPRVSLP